MEVTNSLDVRLASEQDQPVWDHFVMKCEHASFYHRFGWMQVMRHAFGHEVLPLVCSEGDTVRGVLPLVLINSKIFGKILCSLPFLNYCGVASDSDSADAALLESARCIAREKRVDYLELRSSRELSIENLCLSTHKISMSIALEEDAEALWSRFSSKHRTNIRRAYKNGLAVEKTGREGLEAFYEIMVRAWRWQGTPFYRRRFFDEILDSFPDDIEIFVCSHNGDPIAAALNGIHDRTVEGMWAGALPAGRKVQYSYVLYWEMLKDACERQRMLFHLGRSSSDSGGESFKKKWCAEATQLYWYYDLVRSKEMPQLNVDNPKFQLAIKAWRKLPLSVTRLVGPPLARCIP